MLIKNLVIFSACLTVSFIACDNSNSNSNDNGNVVERSHAEINNPKDPEPGPPASSDAPSIATIETSDFILKVHRAFEFTLKPKQYQPFKLDPDRKLAALDISVKNKSATPLEFGKILTMTQILDNKKNNLVAQWVVAAYMVDNPSKEVQKEYDILWSNALPGNSFHRSILLGIKPLKDDKTFTLIVPEKADFNNPPKKEASFTLE